MGLRVLSNCIRIIKKREEKIIIRKNYLIIKFLEGPAKQGLFRSQWWKWSGRSYKEKCSYSLVRGLLWWLLEV